MRESSVTAAKAVTASAKILGDTPAIKATRQRQPEKSGAPCYDGRGSMRLWVVSERVPLGSAGRGVALPLKRGAAGLAEQRYRVSTVEADLGRGEAPGNRQRCVACPLMREPAHPDRRPASRIRPAPTAGLPRSIVRMPEVSA